MKVFWLSMAAACGLVVLQSLAGSEEPGAPPGIQSERSLPGRHSHVARDILTFCKPTKGFWVDLGAGKGDLGIALIEITGNSVVMLDPNAESLAEAVQLARDKGFADRALAVVGCAEAIPFPDDTVDLVASRGSIFFWDDPVKGLKEIYRVLRPGGKAYVGGGAGSGYPKSAVEKLIQDRKTKMEGAEAEKWKRFVELRRPEQMQAWAEQAGLREFQVMGQGAISDADRRVGQGVWLLFEKHAEGTGEPAN